MKVLVIDGQGGKIGKQLVEAIRLRLPSCELCAVGTNSIATSVMLKAGCTLAATGENAVIVSCRTADVIIGPLGIVIADSLMGEVSPAMAAAVGSCPAVKILIPMNRCDTLVAGVDNIRPAELIESAIKKLSSLADAQKIKA